MLITKLKNGDRIKIKFDYYQEIGRNKWQLGLYSVDPYQRIKTLCRIYTKTSNGNELMLGGGWAIKCPYDTNINKNIGRKIALKRALKNCKDLNKNTCKQIWETYFATHRQ
ncbi:MAG: hypothetical protein BAJALOKI3v1_50012 [Promethearchaeota archaeon]|nr:MAG: hypothetical protein BAJALOKI3v1_50012 [Candidatus Lokiarchaeota archaeon]